MAGAADDLLQRQGKTRRFVCPYHQWAYDLHRVFDGRAIKVLGYSRQRIPSNWKLMFENIKDPYHASLLHVFLVTFGLFRADNPSKVRLDETGRHAVLVSSKGEQKAIDATSDMTNMREDFKLNDLRLLDPVKEYAEATVAMLTLWPNIIIQQQANTLAMRHLVPRGPQAFDLVWTFFGYEDDDEASLASGELDGTGWFRLH